MNPRAPRILIVEDEFLLADDLAEAVRGSGAELIGPAFSLDQAMTLLGAHEIDAAVLDINLRGKNALPLADLCAQRGICFVLTTGYERSDLQGHASAPCFQKPAIPSEVVRTVLEMVTASQ